MIPLLLLLMYDLTIKGLQCVRILLLYIYVSKHHCIAQNEKNEQTYMSPQSLAWRFTKIFETNLSKRRVARQLNSISILLLIVPFVIFSERFDVREYCFSHLAVVHRTILRFESFTRVSIQVRSFTHFNYLNYPLE